MVESSKPPPRPTSRELILYFGNRLPDERTRQIASLMKSDEGFASEMEVWRSLFGDALDADDPQSPD